MTEQGYKGGLVSRVKNPHSGKRYTISTSQEVGRDYWTTSVFRSILFGFLPIITKPIFTIVRNNKEDAHVIHWKVKNVIMTVPESYWLEMIPNPEPPEGWSKDAEKILKKKLGDKF